MDTGRLIILLILTYYVLYSILSQMVNL